MRFGFRWKAAGIRNLSNSVYLKEIGVNVLVRLANVDRKTLLITSASAGEGKTTIAFGLACLFAREGKKTLLISDVKGPLTGVSVCEGPPLEELLAGKSAPPPEPSLPYLVRIHDSFFLHLYESKGPKEWGEGFNMVVVDAPVLTHPLAQFLAPLVDGVILVADIKNTRQTYMMAAKQDIEALGGRFYGCILNRHSDPIPSFVTKWIRFRR